MLKELFSTDIGLLSLGVIVFIIVMGAYIGRRLSKLSKAPPGEEGWK